MRFSAGSNRPAYPSPARLTASWTTIGSSCGHGSPMSSRSTGSASRNRPPIRVAHAVSSCHPRSVSGIVSSPAATAIGVSSNTAGCCAVT